MLRIRLARGLAAVALMVLAGAAQAAVLGPSLQKALVSAEAGTPLQVVVTFHGASKLDARQIALLTGAGVRGYRFHALPMAGVLATPDQIRALAALPEVRSIWANDAHEYENADATTITGVKKQREIKAFQRHNGGLPFTGRGVGVVVNDSGIDATHEDLKLGENVVQNVFGWTDLGGLAYSEAGLEGIPPTPRLENQLHTDIILNGHGTHVSGIVGGTGEYSGGKYRGVAYEANIIGHSGGAAALLLNLLGGFDYAIDKRHVYNVRVVTNSWGSTGEMGLPFNPDDPLNVATKLCADAGMVVVFSAGNQGSGPDTITGNYKKAPWVVTVAAGSKDGGLTDFSSRGKPDFGVQKITIDGEEFDLTDRPTVVSPGFNIISARAKSADAVAWGLALTPYFDLVEPSLIEPEMLPYYTTVSGTSQAAPHVAGIIALMMQANPDLDWKQVKRILQATATNLPTLADYEGGAGYVNAVAAMSYALGLRTDYGRTNKLLRSFNSSIVKVGAGSTSTDYDVLFSPVGDPANVDFEVGADTVLVTASMDTLVSTVGLSLIDPDGTRHSSSIAIGPSTLTVSAPGKPGSWRATVRGIGSVAGVPISPPVPGWNGWATPEPETVTVSLTSGAEEMIGLGDILDHPLRGFIEAAVKARLLDGRPSGLFEPDARLTRLELANYLALGAGLRQNLRFDGKPRFTDLNAVGSAYAEAAASIGASLKTLNLSSRAPIGRPTAEFDPAARVSRLQMSVAMLNALGRQEQVKAFAGQPTAVVDGVSYPVTDVGATMGGYVHYALALGLVLPTIVTEPDPVTGAPREVAHFLPHAPVLRGEYARSALAAATAYGVHADTSLVLPTLP